MIIENVYCQRQEASANRNTSTEDSGKL